MPSSNIMDKVAAAPFGWYRPDTYARLREIALDKYNLPETFEEWRKRAQRLFDELRSQGFPVMKVMIDPDEMLRWAIAQGRAVDSKARATYAVVAFGKQNDRTH